MRAGFASPHVSTPRWGADRGRANRRWLPTTAFLTAIFVCGCGESQNTGSPSSDSVAKIAAVSSLAEPTTSVPPPSATDWQLNGSAVINADSLSLTSAQARKVAGSAFWRQPIVDATSVTVTFDAAIDGGTGADGLTVAFANAALVKTTSLGAIGGGLGWSGLSGFAVALDTFQNPGDPSYNSVGVVIGSHLELPDHLNWVESARAAQLLRKGVRHIGVAVQRGLLTVTIDGAEAFRVSVMLPHRLLLGFTGANGARTDRHIVSNVKITFA
jgi:hypothetical protein